MINSFKSRPSDSFSSNSSVENDNPDAVNRSGRDRRPRQQYSPERKKEKPTRKYVKSNLYSKIRSGTSLLAKNTEGNLVSVVKTVTVQTPVGTFEDESIRPLQNAAVLAHTYSEDATNSSPKSAKKIPSDSQQGTSTPSTPNPFVTPKPQRKSLIEMTKKPKTPATQKPSASKPRKSNAQPRNRAVSSDSEVSEVSDDSDDEFQYENLVQSNKKSVTFAIEVEKGVEEPTPKRSRGRPKNPETALRRELKANSAPKKRGRPPKRALVVYSDKEEENEKNETNENDKLLFPIMPLLRPASPTPASLPNLFMNNHVSPVHSMAGLPSFNVLDLNLEKNCPELYEKAKSDFENQQIYYNTNEHLKEFLTNEVDEKPETKVVSEPIQPIVDAQRNSENTASGKAEEAETRLPLAIPPLPNLPFPGPGFSEFQLFVKKMETPSPTPSPALQTATDAKPTDQQNAMDIETTNV